ncbi:hypothetical protein JXA02_14065, partial [candidate division KSB1 bacterium]|nr:hypothetical protein [candidate division KSB1 bacterium]
MFAQIIIDRLNVTFNFAKFAAELLEHACEVLHLSNKRLSNFSQNSNKRIQPDRIADAITRH